MKEIINENKRKLIISESELRNMITETVKNVLINKELEELFNYLKQDSTVNVTQMLKQKDTHPFSQKAYNYFEPKAILHDVWVIHFTNLEGYEDIPKNGFKYGENDINKLAYTSSETEGKYSFALLLNNPYIDNYDFGYGDCALVFKTDGVLAYHKIDGDDELIFINSNINSKIYPLIFDEGPDEDGKENTWHYDGKGYDTLRDAINHIKLQ